MSHWCKISEMIDQVWVQVGRGKIAETFEMW